MNDSTPSHERNPWKEQAASRRTPDGIRYRQVHRRTPTAVAWGDLDFDEFDRHPLPANTLRTLRYMCDVEYHTVCYLRDLLTTPSHKEPEVGAFMTMWNREEFWHGEALAAVLGKHGITVDFDELKATRVKLGWKDRLDPIKQSLLGGLVGNDFVAVHMAWGAANEWSANAAYLRMAEKEKHPVLAELLKRIAKQETRHVAFYASQARDRLLKSKKAQVIARFALNKFWAPVGSGISIRRGGHPRDGQTCSPARTVASWSATSTRTSPSCPAWRV